MKFWIITILVILICIIAIYFIVKNMNKKLEKLFVYTNNKKICYVCKICGCPCFKGDNMCPDCLTPIPKDYFQEEEYEL